MRGFNHATILNSPTFHGLRRERLAQWRPICIQTTTEKTKGWGGGGTSRKIGWGCAARFLNPYPVSDQNLWFSYPISDLIINLISYFRPETLEPSAWPERVTSCYGTYTVGVNIKREMVLSPNDEEVANSSKKHTQFKTRVHKPYPI